MRQEYGGFLDLVIGLIILPQALKASLPAMINLVVMAFKNTSVLFIVGLLELPASGNIAYQSSDWGSYHAEVLVFIALAYFTFSCSLSRYGAFLERRMRRGAGLSVPPVPAAPPSRRPRRQRRSG